MSSSELFAFPSGFDLTVRRNLHIADIAFATKDFMEIYPRNPEGALASWGKLRGDYEKFMGYNGQEFDELSWGADNLLDLLERQENV